MLEELCTQLSTSLPIRKYNHEESGLPAGQHVFDSLMQNEGSFESLCCRPEDREKYTWHFIKRTGTGQLPELTQPCCRGSCSDVTEWRTK